MCHIPETFFFLSLRKTEKSHFTRRGVLLLVALFPSSVGTTNLVKCTERGVSLSGQVRFINAFKKNPRAENNTRNVKKSCLFIKPLAYWWCVWSISAEEAAYLTLVWIFFFFSNEKRVENRNIRMSKSRPPGRGLISQALRGIDRSVRWSQRVSRVYITGRKSDGNCGYHHPDFPNQNNKQYYLKNAIGHVPALGLVPEVQKWTAEAEEVLKGKDFVDPNAAAMQLAVENTHPRCENPVFEDPHVQGKSWWKRLQLSLKWTGC